MSRACPQCRRAFEQRSHCPDCQVALISYSEAEAKTPIRPAFPWMHTSWGRIIVGLVLAQGLYYALRQFALAGIVATGEQFKLDDWTISSKLAVSLGLQVVTVLLAGLLVGASQHNGAIYGAVMGVWSGIACLILYPIQGSPFGAAHVFSMPLILAISGGMGGLFGSYFWKPIAVAVPVPELEDTKKRPPNKAAASLFAGPIAWVRVILGSGIAICGSAWAYTIIGLIEQAGQGELNLENELNAQLVKWEVVVLAMIVGGAFAGANTRNGLKQGLAVGIVTAVGLMGLRIGQIEPSWKVIAMTWTAPVFLCLVGGGFGGKLLPPVRQRKSRRRYLDPA